MENITNEENEWDQMVEADVAKEPEERVTCKEKVRAIQKKKSRKATGPSEVSVDVMDASGKIRLKVSMNLCQRILNSTEMPDKWKTSVIMPIFKRKVDMSS